MYNVRILLDLCRVSELSDEGSDILARVAQKRVAKNFQLEVLWAVTQCNVT